MSEALECYTVRLPITIKRMIRILAAEQDCTQQELLIRLIKQEKEK